MKRTPMRRSRIKPIGKKRSKVMPDGREGLTGAKAAGSLPDELRRYGVASETIDNPQGETLPEGSTVSASTSVPDQFKPKMKRSSLNPVGRKRSKVMPDGREILRGADYQKRREEVWERDGRRCQGTLIHYGENLTGWCGKLLRLQDAHIHHVRKRTALGGRDDSIGNLKLLCPECHRRFHEAERRRK